MQRRFSDYYFKEIIKKYNKIIVIDNDIFEIYIFSFVTHSYLDILF